jgi:hypothetical protein
MKITKNGQEAHMAQSIDAYVTQSIAAVDASITQSIEKFDASTTESDALDTYVIQSIIDLDTYVTQFIAAWWSLIQDTEQNEEANEEDEEDEDDDEANERVIEEDATLEEDEREAAATLRILMNEDVANMPIIDYFLLNAEIDSILVECPSLLKKIPGYHEAVTETIAKMRNRVHLIYHPNDRAPIGVSMDHVAYMEADHVAAAALMLHTFDELEEVMGAEPLP